MTDNSSEDRGLPKEVKDILDAFRQTSPPPGEHRGNSGSKREDSETREKARQECIDKLAAWARENPEERGAVQKVLFRLLEQDLSGRVRGECPPRERPYGEWNGEEDPGVNNLMRSYLPIFIGALHWRQPTDLELRRSAREGLLGRLVGQASGEHRVKNREFSPTVRQWLIRILRRVFAGQDEGFAEELVQTLADEIVWDDNILTQVVILVEASKLESVASDAASICIDKVKDFTRSGSIVAARGLERLAPKIREPDEAMVGLCQWLTKLHRDAAQGDPAGEPTANVLADWEVFADEAMERRAVIKALAALGPAGDPAVNRCAINLLSTEAEWGVGTSDGDRDVAVAAVLALGKLGAELPGVEENRDEGPDPLEKVRATLTRTAVCGEATVANAAARALRNVTEDEADGTVRIVDCALDPETASDDDRVAEAARLIDSESAIDRLARVEGDDQGRAEHLITKIGGRHAFEVLQPHKRARGVKKAIDLASIGLVAVTFFGAWIAMAGAEPPFQRGWPLGLLLMVALGVAVLFLAPWEWIEKIRYVQWDAEDLESFRRSLWVRGGAATVLALLLIAAAMAIAGIERPLQDWWPGSWWWPGNAVLWSGCFVLSAFFASVLIAFPFRPEIRPTRYLVSSILASVFSVGMIAFIGNAQWLVENGDFPDDDVLWSGPVYIFRGSYTENGDPQAIASLSPPPESLDTLDEVRGFGAPLWVVLLAVLGSSLLTVAVIVTEVSNPPNLSDTHWLRQRVGALLEHQFYILFAPVGAIFVYTGLVQSNLHNNDLTVGLAAFGAGLAWNVVLARAVNIAGRTIYHDAKPNTLDSAPAAAGRAEG